MGKLSFDEARHLVSRTGIGSEWKTIQRYQTLNRAQAIQHLLKNQDFHLPPFSGASSWQKMQSLKGNMRRKKMVMRIAKV